MFKEETYRSVSDFPEFSKSRQDTSDHDLEVEMAFCIVAVLGDETSNGSVGSFGCNDHILRTKWNRREHAIYICCERQSWWEI